MQQVFILLVVLGNICAHTIGLDIPIEKKSIVNGYDAKQKWDFYVYILMCISEDECYICGGSMIREKTVLTAAHCIEKGAKISSIVAGDFTDEYSRKETIKVTGYYAHENFVYPADNSDLKPQPNDIALLHLERAPANSKTISLCTGNDYSQDLMNVIGMGVSGKPTSNNPDFPDVLQQVQLHHSNICPPHPPIDTNSQFCLASDDHKDTCLGDSGGPVFPETNELCLYGLVSYGSENCSGWGVYTEVGAFADWINKHANE